MFEVYKDLDETCTLDDRYKHDFIIAEVGGRAMFIETFLGVEVELTNVKDPRLSCDSFQYLPDVGSNEYMDTANTFEEAFNLIKMYQTME